MYLLNFELISTTYAACSSSDLSCQYSFAGYSSVGDFLNKLLPAIYTIVGFALFFYFIWAGLLYMTAGANKDQTAKARGMITHAIIGLVLLLVSFLIIPFLLGATFGMPGIIKVVGP